MPRKPRSDSAAAALRAAVNAASPLPDPPKFVRMRDGDAPFWNAIVRARSKDEWSSADLVIAAQLARAQADIERESIQLEAEGSVVENARGTQVMNPRVTVLEQLARREMALMRTLQMGGSAKGRKEDVLKKRSLEDQARSAKESLIDEDLLA